MAAYQQQLRKKYKRMRFKTCMIEIEPACAMSCHPERFDVELDRKSFADYYRYHSLPRQNHWQEMGYSRSACPIHSEVSKFFCTHFCERFKAGWASPLICNTLEAMWKAGAFQAIDKVWRLKEEALIPQR
jgi:hypothetical protein